jgi:uncharacterized membrane protein
MGSPPVLATVHSSAAVLVLAVFLACAVEMVEAFTIVLAVGTTRGWRSALEGAAVAVVALAALVGVAGPALVHAPVSGLRVVVGGVLLVFGLGWLRKAVLRASGLKAKHDEDQIFADRVAELAGPVRAPGTDGAGFAVAFKGVFLEGVEVVIIVLTLGSTDASLGLAAAAAAAALVVVGVVGLLVARQLSGVPENALKMGVGLMLVSFGTFFAGEGLHVHWPGADLAVVVLVAGYGALSWLLVRWLRPDPTAAGDTAAEVGRA